MRKLTLEEIKEKLEVINPNIEILSTEYVSHKQKLQCKCLVDGNVWDLTWQHLSQGVGCRKCASRDKRLPLTKIREKIKKINPNVMLISTEYEINSNDLKYKCSIHNHEWSESWDSVSKGKICRKCSEDKKLNIQKIKENLFFINPNIKILSDRYINNSAKLKCKCKIDGYEWSATWSNLSRGTGCPECGGKRRDYTIEDIRKKLFKIYPNIEILSNKYISAKTKLKCKCLIDGYEWESNWNNLSTSGGCPECNGKRRDYTVEKIGEKLKLINPNIKILSTKYKNSFTRLKCECLVDGYIWNTNWGNLRNKLGCPECSKAISKCEKIIYDFLEECKITHIREYSFEDLFGDSNRVLRFDFAIFYNDKLIYLIEYDGEFHYEKYYKEQNFERQQRYDKLKNEYCIKNNIPLVRIPYWEKDNISEILTDIFICKNSNNKFIINNNQITGQAL